MKQKSISLVFCQYFIPFFIRTLINIYCERQLKNFPGLSLLYKDLGSFSVCGIIIINIKFWMTTAIIPLVPEPVKILTSNIFKGKTKVLSFCRTEFFGSEVQV